ncbi:MAG: VTT domain-containing protein [Pseudomonadota bacterium]
MNEFPNWLMASLDVVGTMPAVLFILIIAGSFILEDAATAAAALFAAEGLLPLPVAMLAVYTGIIIGDIGLYGLGVLAHRNGVASRWVDQERTKAVRLWAHDKLWSVVFTSRFIPGMRLPTYIAAGYVRAKFRRFVLAVVAATLVWSSALFFALYWLGQTLLKDLGPWKWAAAALLIAIVVLGERALAARRKRARATADNLAKQADIHSPPPDDSDDHHDGRPLRAREAISTSVKNIARAQDRLKRAVPRPTSPVRVKAQPAGASGLAPGAIPPKRSR